MNVKQQIKCMMPNRWDGPPILAVNSNNKSNGRPAVEKGAKEGADQCARKAIHETKIKMMKPCRPS